MLHRTAERRVVNPLLEEIKRHGCGLPLPPSHPYATSRKTAVHVADLTEYEEMLRREFRNADEDGQPARMPVRQFVQDFTPPVEEHFAEIVPEAEVPWRTRDTLSRVVAAGKITIEDANILHGIFTGYEPPQIETAKGVLFARHQPNARRFADHVVGERSDVDRRKRQILVEDAADKALCILLYGPNLSGQQPLDAFLGNSQFTTWLYRIISNQVGTELRSPVNRTELNPESLRTGSGPSYELYHVKKRKWLKESLFESTPPPWPNDQEIYLRERGPEEQVKLAAFRLDVDNIIQQEFTFRQRAAFIPIVLEGKDPEEIAALLGTRRNNVYKIVHDARVKLRERLKENGWTGESLGLLD